jgi:hypothetical protein
MFSGHAHVGIRTSTQACAAERLVGTQSEPAGLVGGKRPCTGPGAGQKCKRRPLPFASLFRSLEWVVMWAKSYGRCEMARYAQCPNCANRSDGDAVYRCDNCRKLFCHSCARGMLKWANMPQCPFCDGGNTERVGKIGKGLLGSLFG